MPHPFLDLPTPIVIGHRGSAGESPENTLASIKAAVQARADWVEWDTRVTIDGRVLVQHDATLERFVGKKLKISKLTFEEARALDVGSWFDDKFKGEQMPTLEEAIESSLPKSKPLIERKSGSARQHFEILEKMGVIEKVAVQAFDWDFLRDLRKLSPGLELGALGEKKISDEKLLAIVEMKVGFVGWKAQGLKRGDVERLHANGIKVAVWTVDDPKEIRKFVSWGIDAIITNDPVRTRQIVEGQK
jgi:glycerophosphoryl diester phosphodiesterase